MNGQTVGWQAVKMESRQMKRNWRGMKKKQHEHKNKTQQTQTTVLKLVMCLNYGAHDSLDNPDGELEIAAHTLTLKEEKNTLDIMQLMSLTNG